MNIFINTGKVYHMISYCYLKVCFPKGIKETVGHFLVKDGIDPSYKLLTKYEYIYSHIFLKDPHTYTLHNRF